VSWPRIGISSSSPKSTPEAKSSAVEDDFLGRKRGIAIDLAHDHAATGERTSASSASRCAGLDQHRQPGAGEFRGKRMLSGTEQRAPGKSSPMGLFEGGGASS